MQTSLPLSPTTPTGLMWRDSFMWESGWKRPYQRGRGPGGKTMRVEYRVRPVTRYVVTRWYEADRGDTGGCEQRGEFDHHDTAYQVAYALCKAEHERLGYPVGDMRVIYPEPCITPEPPSAMRCD